MRLRALAEFAFLLILLPASVAIAAKPSDHAAGNPAISTSSEAAAQEAPKNDNDFAPRDFQPPPAHITVANPPATVIQRTWQDQVSWAANLVLVILGYVGIMMAVSLLKKIDRQTGYAEAAAETAAAAAQAALLNAQAIVRAERPWILITIEPSRSKENTFTIMATNRGRTPAVITENALRRVIAIDETHLPETPEYRKEKTAPVPSQAVLLPGESTPIEPFSREDVRALCDSEERFRRIETWEERIYIYGKIIYKDLNAPADNPPHETHWCCWYIHGRQNSGLVMAGPPEYHSHS
jgi:hypothetical protein